VRCSPGALVTAEQPNWQGRLASALHGGFGQVRALGSAALDLAWTAAGRCDAFYHEEWAKPWDIAAGVLLCETAGLEVLQLEPAMPRLSNRVLAAPPELMRELKALVETA
jgi:myo-inositol-1(or 4)-monophosphatase